MKYKSLPGSRVAPNGSITPVAIFVSFATALIISGLNWGSENTQLTLSCSITSLISASCSAPGITSVLTVNAPRILMPNLFSKYWYASWKTMDLKSLFNSDFTFLVSLSKSLCAFFRFALYLAKYKANLKKAHKDLDKLTKKVKSELNKDFKSIVFHDAYQYFEKRFGINILGAFTVNTDVMPGAEQLAEIREVIEHDKVSCVFSEPQFNPDIIKAVAKDTNIATGVIDPLGATLDPGKDLYFNLIGNMSKSFKGC